MSYLTRSYKGIAVSYLTGLDGGGMGFGQDYIPVVKQLFGPVDRVFEFCAGPGFIGFSLLAHGLCKSLCLSDINPEAVLAAKDTVKRNNLEHCVSVYQSDALAQIPASEKWDLVVSNPPHFKNQYKDSIRHYDRDWEIHRRFYVALKGHLNPGAAVLIQENLEGSEQVDFLEMIGDSGLAYEGAFMWADLQRRNYLDTYYFVLSRRSEDAVKIGERPVEWLDCEKPAPIFDVNLGVRTNVRFESRHRYRFRFENRIGREVTLLTFARRFGIVPRFIRSFGVIGPASKTISSPFHFYPGRYELKDAQTRKAIIRVIVA